MTYVLVENEPRPKTTQTTKNTSQSHRREAYLNPISDLAHHQSPENLPDTLRQSDRVWTPERVADRFAECVSVFQRMPSAVRLGYVTYWPEGGLPEKSQRGESEKNTNTKRPKESIRLPPTPQAIDRAEEVLSWGVLVSPGERQLLWLRAHRVSWRGIARETGFPKSSAQRYWERALVKIAEALMETAP